MSKPIFDGLDAGECMLGDVQVGETFTCDGVMYQKTNEVDGFMIRCVKLLNGHLHNLGSDSWVTLVPIRISLVK